MDRASTTILICASHLGFPMDRTPLGGGGMVATELIRTWSNDPSLEVFVIGAGRSPTPGSALYVQALEGCPAPSSLSELPYARFCRRFEAAATRRILALSEERPVVVVNDISESPDLARLKKEGLSIASIWHVDVADFFSKLYLRGAVGPAKAALLYECLRRLGLARWTPDVLKLVYEKQRASVLCSDRIYLPSKGMVGPLLAAYGPFCRDLERKIRIVPWGALETESEPAEAELSELRTRYGISPATRVLLTLSRISPEKGLGRLIEALSLLEPRLGREVTLFVCGEAAFGGGARERRRLERLALRLRRFRVHFPGYVSGARKRAFFGLAHLFVSPSIHESYGLAVAEAMSAGLPVLAADHYGSRELVREGRGVLVRDGRPESFAEALRSLLLEPSSLDEMSRAARLGVPPFRDAAELLAADLKSLG